MPKVHVLFNKEMLINEDNINKAIKILNEYKQNNFPKIYKLNTFKQSIIHRLSLTNSNTIESYLSLLKKSTVEKNILYELLIPTKSQFFRNPKSWQSLEKNVIPQLIANKPLIKELNFWVAGCGTGEDAYSLAMLLDEIVLAAIPNFKVQIIATDVSKDALTTAVKGVYQDWIANDVRQDRLQRYFLKKNNTFTVKHNLVKLIRFLPHDLIKPIGFTNINLVCCRNTLIYFKPKYNQKALKMLVDSLVPQGFLFLGDNELLDFNHNYISLQCPGQIFMKRDDVELHKTIDRSFSLIVNADKIHLKFKELNSARERLKKLESRLDLPEANLQNSIEKQQELKIIEEIDREIITANTNIKKINQELYSVNRAYQLQVKKLKELNSDLENLLRSIDIGVIFLDRQLKIHKYNSSAQKIINFRNTDIGRSIKDLKHNLEYVNLNKILEQFLQTQYPDKLEVKNSVTKECLLMKLHCYRLESQQQDYLESGQSSASSEANESQTCEGIILTFVDISDRKLAEQTLEYQAFYDSLTGLPNRLLFKEQLQHAVNRLSRQHSRFLAVLYLDLNGFKEVNDSLGHSAGDLLLIGVAHRLNEVVRSNDVVCRLGGDEFVILLEEIYSPEQSLEIAFRIHQILAHPFSIKSSEGSSAPSHGEVYKPRQITISTSIGIAFYSARDNLGSIETLIENADMAMYRAKQRGIAETEIFSPLMRSQAQATMKFKNQLSLALQQKEFVLYYQPIFRLKDGKLQGFECLIRWNSPKQSLIYPDEFLPLIQNSPLRLQLELWIIEQACEQLYQWTEQFEISNDFSLSINISPQLITYDNFFSYINEILDKKHNIARHLTIELTETALIYKTEVVEVVLKQLRTKGIKIALDDFGTGFSSLSHVHRFPLDIIKIDRSFILSLFKNERSKHIVRSIIFMSQQMNVAITAEGIETIELLQWLQEHNCQLGQGYFWSPALVTAAANNLLTRTNT